MFLDAGTLNPAYVKWYLVHHVLQGRLLASLFRMSPDLVFCCVVERLFQTVEENKGVKEENEAVKEENEAVKEENKALKQDLHYSKRR
jgi:hypothetical protein